MTRPVRVIALNLHRNVGGRVAYYRYLKIKNKWFFFSSFAFVVLWRESVGYAARAPRDSTTTDRFPNVSNTRFWIFIAVRQHARDRHATIVIGQIGPSSRAVWRPTIALSRAPSTRRPVIPEDVFRIFAPQVIKRISVLNFIYKKKKQIIGFCLFRRRIWRYRSTLMDNNYEQTFQILNAGRGGGQNPGGP